MGKGARPPCRLKSRGAGDPVEGVEGGAVHRRSGETAPAARCVGELAPEGDTEEGGGEELLLLLNTLIRLILLLKGPLLLLLLLLMLIVPEQYSFSFSLSRPKQKTH